MRAGRGGDGRAGDGKERRGEMREEEDGWNGRQERRSDDGLKGKE